MPLILAFTYFFILTGNVSHQGFLYSFIAAIITTVGFAGIGYWTNDLSDRKKDAMAGKENSLSNLSKYYIVSIGIVFFALAILPWFYLPFDRISLLLISVEFILFFVYAFPPFRLKEKGFLGLIADALYAHVVPALLASWTFYLVGGKNYIHLIAFLVSLGIWQLISGVRNIVSHQLKDYENDQRSNTNTWTLTKGKISSEKLINTILIPMEILAFFGFLIFIQLEIIYLFPVIIIFLFIAFKKFKKAKDNPSETIRKHFTNIFLDDFYIKWLPLLILSGMVFIETEVRWVLLFHLILFQKQLKNVANNIVKRIKNKILNSSWIQRIFAIQNYYKSFATHLLILLLYTFFFVAGYFVLKYLLKDQGSFMIAQSWWSKLFIAMLFLHLGAFFMFRKESTIQTIKEFIFEKGSAYNLAIFRIFFFCILIGSFYIEVFGSFLDWSYLPESDRVGLPFIGWIIDILPISPEIYETVAIVGLLLAYTGLLGLGTKWTLKLYIPIALYLWGVPCFFGKLNHHHIMVWVPIIFAFSRCSDVLSLDALYKKIKGKFIKPLPSVEYGLPFKVLWILLAMIYCCSGFHKLWDTGLYWALSENLVNQIQLEWVENYDVVSNFRIDHYPIFLKISGMGVILFEIIYPLFLLKPATRILNFTGSWALHLTAGYFLKIDFAYLRRVHYSLFNWERLRHFFISNKKSSHQELLTETSEPKTIKDLMKYSIFYPGVLLVGFNLVFGILGISSWPFSAYPAYSGIVKSEVQLIRMEAFNKDGKTLDVKKIGKEANFRWENIRPFEERISESLEKKDALELQKKLESYWNLWSTKVEGLSEINSIDMYLETTTLIPEERDKIISSVYLGRVTPEL
jgi:hypothetical protein